ncbi:MAG: L-serine ammonia-lyase, iron-sulfur-dependent subunit beta [Bacillota bacterium]
MPRTDVFGIIGPIMIGPSSSHTAGAARIGRMTRAICPSGPRSARIILHGSFAETGRGHGTHLALVAGLLGLQPGDDRLRRSLDLAREAGLSVSIERSDLGNVHPNTARLEVTCGDGSRTAVVGSSLGGGNVVITNIDGFEVEIYGNYHTLVISHADEPGMLSRITSRLAEDHVNIANMRTSRKARGQTAMTVIETDHVITPDLLQAVRTLPHVESVLAVPPVR